MALTQISDNQIAQSTSAIITTLSFLNNDSVFKLPTGATGDRPDPVTPGTMRFNSDLDKAEVYVADSDGNGLAGWIEVGGGGGPSLGGDSVIRCHPDTITEDSVIGATTGDEYVRAFTVGPVTVQNGVSITVENGAIWKII